MTAKKVEEVNEKAVAPAEQAAEQAAEQTEMIDPMKKMIKIKLFKDGKEYKDDVFVSVNGKSFQIQRGVEVEVPLAVAEVIERSIELDGATASFVSKIEEDYIKKDKDN